MQESGKKLDEAFSRYVLKTQMATKQQLADALDSQKMVAEHDMHLPLGEALVRLGAITPLQRTNVENLIQNGLTGPKQLSHYQLLKKLGEGKMGAVFLAQDTAASRKVALKLLPAELAADAEFLDRFRHEARATGKLNHINIVTAFSMGEDAGQHFYVMEYCEGESLESILAREKFLRFDKALEITLQIAHGLKHAHDHSIVHRDIKPGNVMLTPEGVVKILDMGLSKSLVSADESFKTQSGYAVGTPHYMSPEQCKGDRTIDGRADIYSLGATLYHLVTGVPPFTGKIEAVMSKQISDEVRNPQDIRDDISDSVVHLIGRMMAKSRSDRYQDCSELAADIEAVLEGKMPLSLPLDATKSSVGMRGVKFDPPPHLYDSSPKTQDASAEDENRKHGSRKPATVIISQNLLRRATRDGFQGKTGAWPVQTKYAVACAITGACILLVSLFIVYGVQKDDVAEAPSPSPALAPVEIKSALPNSDVPNVAAVTKSAIVNLIPLIDPQKDAVVGTWLLKDGVLVSDDSGALSGGARLQIPYHPPQEYDFRITFTRVGGDGDVTQILAAPRTAFAWKMGAVSNTIFAFDQTNSAKSNSAVLKRAHCLQNGRKYESLVQVRKTGVKAFLDGALVIQWSTDYSDLSNPPAWKLRDDQCLGVASWNSPTVFDKIEIEEVTGSGTRTRP